MVEQLHQINEIDELRSLLHYQFYYGVAERKRIPTNKKKKKEFFQNKLLKLIHVHSIPMRSFIPSKNHLYT